MAQTMTLSGNILSVIVTVIFAPAAMSYTRNVTSLSINVIPSLPPVRSDNLTIFELVMLSQLQKFIDLSVDQVPNEIWRSTSFLTNLLDSSQWSIQTAKRRTLKATKSRNTYAALINQRPLENLFDLFEFNIQGYDREGCPVVILPFGLWHTYRTYLGKIKSVKEVNKNLTVYFLNMVEQIIKNMRGSCAQFTVIADVDDYHDFHNSGLKYFKDGIKLFDKMYPGLLKLAFFINSTPSFLENAQSHKSTLPWDLRRKSFIFSDRFTWTSAILKYIDETQLPPKYGGTNYILE